VKREIDAFILFLATERGLSAAYQASVRQSLDALAVLAKIARILAPDGHEIQVEGHTDNIPIRTRQYPSNWELSTARARCSHQQQPVVRHEVKATSQSATWWEDDAPNQVQVQQCLESFPGRHRRRT